MIDPEAVRAAYEAGDADAFARSLQWLPIDLTLAKLRALAPTPDELAMFGALLRGVARSVAAGGNRGVGIHGPGARGRASVDPDGDIQIEIATDTRKRPLRLRVAYRIPPVVDADLLAAVLADPDDLAARSVYADALLQRGDPRGALLQAQVAQARKPFDPEVRQLAEREWRLRGGLITLEACGGRFTMHAGFIDTLSVTPRQLERVLETGLFARHPIRALEIATPDAQAFARADRLAPRLPATLRELRIGGTPAAPVRHAIDRSPYVSRTGALALHRIVASGAQWRAALASLTADRLELVLAAPVPPELVAALAKRAFLEALAITYAAGADNWAELAALSRLTSVALHGFPVDVLRALIPALFASGRLESFASDDFYGDALADLVVAQPRAARLHTLAVRHSPERLVRTLTALPNVRVVAARLDAAAFEHSRFHPLELAMMLSHSKVRVRCADPVPELARFCA